MNEAEGAQQGVVGLPLRDDEDRKAREPRGFFSLNKSQRGALREALAGKDFETRAKVGWDPAHVETARVTIAEAKAGKR